MLSNDFFERGFQIFDGTEYISLIGNYPFDDQKIKIVQYDIGQKFLKNFEIDDYKIWHGVDEDASVWHADAGMVKGEKQPGCNFLLYFSDMRPYNNGAIWFRYNRLEERILPYPGLLIAINCEERFQHRAEVCTQNQERILITFKYFYAYK